MPTFRLSPGESSASTSTVARRFGGKARRIPPTKRWLEQEQFIWLGRYRIRWRGRLGESAQDGEMLDPLTSHVLDRAEADQLPEAELELPIRIGESLSTWTIGSRLSLIGRSAECQLVLTDNSISTYHASLVRTPLGIWVVDLLSREGVWVNGTRVRWAWLDDGDTMRIGRFTFILRYRSLPDQISRRDVPLDAGAILSAVSGRHGWEFGRLAGAGSETARAADRVKASRLRTQLEPYPPSRNASCGGKRSAICGTPAQSLRAVPARCGINMYSSLEMLHSEMILMVRMFMTMHREHVGSIRDEFDRVQQLTRELETLQAKLGGSSNAANVDPPAGIERRGSERSFAGQGSERTSIAGFSLGRSRREPRAPQLARPRREQQRRSASPAQPTRNDVAKENRRKSTPSSFTRRSPNGSPSSSGNDKGTGDGY